MALTINKTNATPVAPAEAANPIPYLSADLSAKIMALPAEVSGLFTAATELTPDLIEAAAPGLSEELMEELITAVEAYLAQNVPVVTAPVPAAQVVAQPPKADDRKARRDELKAQIAANSGQGTVTVKQNEKSVVPANAAPDAPKDLAQPAQPVVTAPASTVNVAQVASLGLFDSLFPIGQMVTIVNRGGGKFELTIGKMAPAVKEPVAEAPAKEKKPKVGSIYNFIVTDEYLAFIEDMKTNYPDLPSRIALAESLGLVRGTDWNIVTKDGKPMPPSIENMFLVDAIRTKKGIEQYVEGARTADERKGLLAGTLPWPATAKPRQ